MIKPRIVIIYHSGYGHTKVVAQAIQRGAEENTATEVRLFSVEEVDWDVLLDADCIVFGSPTYMGSVSAPFKEFMDKSGKIWLKQQWKDKLAAGFTNAGSLSGDKLNVLIQLALFAAQHGMNWITLGIVPSNHNDEGNGEAASVLRLNRMGSYLGAMAQSGNDSPEVTPPTDDIRTAELFGKRIADATYRWVAGALGV